MPTPYIGIVYNRFFLTEYEMEIYDRLWSCLFDLGMKLMRTWRDCFSLICAFTSFGKGFVCIQTRSRQQTSAKLSNLKFSPQYHNRNSHELESFHCYSQDGVLMRKIGWFCLCWSTARKYKDDREYCFITVAIIYLKRCIVYYMRCTGLRIVNVHSFNTGELTSARESRWHFTGK